MCATRLRNIPIFLKEAFERAVWKHNRLFAGGGKQEPISFHEYVHEPYPVGLGQPNYETIRAFITQDTELLALYDQASQRNAGGANNPLGHNQHSGGEGDEVNLYNVQDDQPEPPKAPTGNSKQAGLRKLAKAAEIDEKAAELYRRVIKDECSSNAACIAMGWRKRPTPLQEAMRAWNKMTVSEREEFRTWVDEQVSPLRDSRFRRSPRSFISRKISPARISAHLARNVGVSGCWFLQIGGIGYADFCANFDCGSCR